MKVNMTPNPLDVVTIHASQGDSEARQWEFELHNNGELIDTSDVTEQMFFKAYKGGTEQLLPENTSTPTTSPFIGDIRYPQGLLTDQEFTYRQSPTESDGLAKIKNLYGNTLVWNQLVQNGNFADNSGWNFPNSTTATTSISNNELSLAYVSGYPSVSQQVNIKKGHKFYLSFDFKASVNKNTSNGFFFYNSNNQSVLVTPLNYTTNYQKYEGVLSYNNFDLAAIRIAYFEPSMWTAGDVISIKNVQIFDLTKMGLDITDPSEFTSLFNLPYYGHNQGSLLSFMGNGIKTVGKNLFNARETYTENGITFTNDNGVITINGTATRNAFFATNIGLRNGSYFIGAFNDEINNYVHVAVQNKSGSYVLDAIMSSKNRTLSLNNDIDNFIIWVNGGTTLNNFVLKPMISFESPEYFEPYTESSTELPISTYFPTGMKSAGNVYDELTESKAITRIKVLDLGTIPVSGWQYYSARSNFYTVIPDIAVPINANTKANAKCILGVPITWNEMLGNQNENGTYAVTQVGTEKRFYIKNTNYSSVTDFMQYINGIQLYYEMETPTETSFTTASLVTENTEIPLSNNDGTLIGKCTEELSAEPGFHDAKIKLSDSDGTCYSNKLQLHVERSPQ